MLSLSRSVFRQKIAFIRNNNAQPNLVFLGIKEAELVGDALEYRGLRIVRTNHSSLVHVAQELPYSIKSK